MKKSNYSQLIPSLTKTLISLILIGSMGGIIIKPNIVLANDYQETLVQKMDNLKQTEERWISINLTTQRLIAWEGQNQVYAVVVSTGKKSTPTQPGIFAIQEKRRTDRMRGQDYDVPNVPYAMYYHGGYAIHGAYWHNRFGTPVSHGCTNVAVNHAEWLFNWASVGTPVIIHY